MCQAVIEWEAEAKRIGRKEGVENLNRLNLQLIEDKRYEDIKRAARDDEYREQLFREYGLEI